MAVEGKRQEYEKLGKGADFPGPLRESNFKLFKAQVLIYDPQTVKTSGVQLTNW